MTTFNLTANGSTSGVSGPGGRSDPHGAPTAETIVVVTGTFGAGNVQIEFSADGGTTWVADGTLVNQTAAFVGTFKTHPGLLARATLAGATSPDIDVTFLS